MLRRTLTTELSSVGGDCHPFYSGPVEALLGFCLSKPLHVPRGTLDEIEAKVEIERLDVVRDKRNPLEALQLRVFKNALHQP